MKVLRRKLPDNQGWEVTYEGFDGNEMSERTEHYYQVGDYIVNSFFKAPLKMKQITEIVEIP